MEGTYRVKATGTRPKIIVSADGRGVVGHAGTRLLADVAEVTGLLGGFSEALAGLRQRRCGHDPGRVAVDVAVMLADGGEAIADLAVLRDQPGLFGSVASDPTAWRVLSDVDDAGLGRLRAARAQAREVAWAQLAETRDGLPESTAAGLPVPGLTLDVDASIVLCHSEKESATRTWKKTFGYHPLFCFLDGTREALSGMLREGRAGSNTTIDHITVLDQALAQIPDAHRYGTPILIRSDSAGCTYGFLAHIRSLRAVGVDTCFSVGVAITEPIRDAIRAATGWIPALDADGDLRDGAEICEITDLLPADLRDNYPDGTRFIVRRERPHPGAQLTLFDTIEGMRHQMMATDTPHGGGSIQFLEARHRGHARVEMRELQCAHTVRGLSWSSSSVSGGVVWLSR
jgi:hypothetical protein